MAQGRRTIAASVAGIRCALVLVVVVGASGVCAHGADKFWIGAGSGGPAGGFWNDNTNWSTPGVPTLGDNAVFDADVAELFEIDLDVNAQVDSASFEDATPFRLNNNALSLATGDITTTGAATHTINSNIGLGAQASWNIAETSGLDVNGVISGSHALAKSGAGALTLNGANTYTGGTTLTSGTVAVWADNNLGAATGPITFTGGTLRFDADFNLANTRTVTLAGSGIFNTNAHNATVAQAIGGTGVLAKAGTGTLTLDGANTYVGLTVIGNGTIAVGNSTALGTGSVFIGGNSTTALLLDTANINVANDIFLTAGAGAITLGTTDFGAGQNSTIGGDVSLIRSATLQAGSNDQTTFSGRITGAGDLTITSPFAPGRRIVLDRGSGDANSFIGDITIAANAHLQIGAANSIANRTIPDAGTINFANAGSQLRISPTASGDFEAVGTLIGPGGIDMVTGAAFTLAIGADNELGTLTGIITDSVGALSINKVGAGTQTFSGANTYTGGTTIAAGALLADNATGSATGSGPVYVNAGATLGGTGTVAGPVTVATGGTLAPGTALGTLTVGGITFDAAAFFEVQLAATDFDPLDVNGQVNLVAGPTLSVLPFDSFLPTIGDQFEVLTWQTGLTGTFANLQVDPFFLANGIDFKTITTNPNGPGNLTLRAIPEPASLTLLAAGGLLLMRRHRTRAA